MLGGEFDLLLVAAFEGQEGDPAEGWIPELLAELEFLLVKAGEVMAAGELNGRVKGSESLYDDFAFDVAAAGAARNLGEQLKGALAGAEIWLVQRQIGVNDPDQSDIGEVETLGNHLRAEQDVNFAGAEIAQDAAEIVLALEGVGIHAFDSRVRKEFGQGVLDLLRADASIADLRVAAVFIGTGRRHRLGVRADVAHQLLILAMERQRDTAIGTAGDVAAHRALQRAGEAAPIQKQNDLLFAFETLGNGFV